jgi:hypothetical protein
MTERQASRWAKQRAQGHLAYAIRAGLAHAGRAGCVVLLSQVAFRAHSPVPPAFLLAEIAIVSAISILLEYFRWNYRELQFFLFNQAQACSGGASRA